MTWLRASIVMYKPVGFETVLSSDKYFPLVDDALGLGFRLRLIYVALATPELHIERVKRRVAEGGHDVDERKIVERRARSFQNLGRMLPKASSAQIWDNSRSEPKLLFQKEAGDLVVYDRKAIPELSEIVLRAHGP